MKKWLSVFLASLMFIAIMPLASVMAADVGTLPPVYLGPTSDLSGNTRYDTLYGNANFRLTTAGTATKDMTSNYLATN